MWYLNARPVAVTGFGGILFWKDGREVPDTVQAVIEFPGGVNMIYDATLANSFDAELRNDLRQRLGGHDARQQGLDVQGSGLPAARLGSLRPQGDFLRGDRHRARGRRQQDRTKSDKPVEILPFTNTPLWFALGNFLRSSSDVSIAARGFRR